MSFIPLKNLIPKALQNAGIASKVASAVILDRFNNVIIEIFGRSILKKIRPLYLKDQILTVACLNSVVAQELRFREEEILSRLNNGPEPTRISRIRIIN